MLPVRSRFAPSPTGDLHAGGAWAAVAAWAVARAGGGVFVVRVEDIDGPRVVPGSEARLLEDLDWLGLVEDEGVRRGGPFAPYRQSERASLYRAAIDELVAQGRLYPCDCSRADVARAASAPHPGEEIVYPGTCREKDPARKMKKEPSLRFRVDASDEAPFVDRVQGPVGPDEARRAGDFVVQRADNAFAYQLAVSVDDLAMRITDVVRGADLTLSTPRQLLVMRALASRGALAWAPRDAAPPRYWHVPLVLGPDGQRLAKRDPGAIVRDHRAAGDRPEALLGKLACGLGLVPTAQPVSASDLAAALRGKAITFRKEPWAIA